MHFEFATATRIIFGPGTLAQIGPLAAAWGRRALVVTGQNPTRAAPLLAALHEQAVAATLYPIEREPNTTHVCEGVAQARAAGCELVIGCGGGSAIDAAKAIAALLTNPGELYDYLEVIGQGRPLLTPPAPMIAIPTTAGTGAEVTRNAVLAAPAHRVKVSLRSPLMLPRLALIDPELTHSVPPAVTAATGLDAFTQVLEPFVCNAPNPLTDALCREGMARAAGALRRAYADGNDAAAREGMALASLCGGLALANAKLGAVHGFAGPLGGMFDAPHGTLCGRLLPYVVAANVAALRARAPAHPALARYAEIGRILTGSAEACAEDAVAWIAALGADLHVPGLSAYGVTPADFPAIVEKATQASSMKGNPIALTEEELTGILTKTL